MELEPKGADQRSSSKKKATAEQIFSCSAGLNGAGLEAHGATTVASAAAFIAAPVAVPEQVAARAAIVAGQAAVLAEFSTTPRRAAERQQATGVCYGESLRPAGGSTDAPDGRAGDSAHHAAAAAGQAAAPVLRFVRLGPAW